MYTTCVYVILSNAHRMFTKIVLGKNTSAESPKRNAKATFSDFPGILQKVKECQLQEAKGFLVVVVHGCVPRAENMLGFRFCINKK